METSQIEKVSNYIAIHGLNILIAVAIFIAGRWATQLVCSSFEKIMKSRKVDETLASFASHLIYYGLMTFVFLAVLSRLGIQTASFIAVLGAAGFAVGMALQGSLSNFAAGVLVVLFRPFRVGDVITAAGVSGQVKEIQTFNAVINSGDNVKMIVPHSQIMGGTIQNFSANELRRVDLKFSVSYREDLQKVKSVINGVLKSEPKVLSEPAPEVAVLELAENGVNFAVRPWAKNAHYWEVYFSVNEKIKLAFEQNGFAAPLPHREIQLVGADAQGAGRGGKH